MKTFDLLLFTPPQEGRYFVLLSLPEAESLRAAMHLSRGRPGGLLGGAEAASGKAMAGVALRVGRLLLDQTDDFEAARIHQQVRAATASSLLDCLLFRWAPEALCGLSVVTMSLITSSLLILSPQEIVRQCFRFFNSDMDFLESEISLLLKALQV